MRVIKSHIASPKAMEFRKSRLQRDSSPLAMLYAPDGKCTKRDKYGGWHKRMLGRGAKLHMPFGKN